MLTTFLILTKQQRLHVIRKEMVTYDLEQTKKYALLKKHGYKIFISNE